MPGASDIASKLAKVLGDDRARALVDELCVEQGIDDLNVPDERYRFAEALIARGGVYEAVGRAIRVAALLQGASAKGSPGRAEREQRQVATLVDVDQ